jgi:L-ribulose-5-phosphate 3-epimerase
VLLAHGIKVMDNEQLCRRSFLKLAAAVGFGTVLTKKTGLIAENQKTARLYKALKIGMLPKHLSDADKFKLAVRCGFEGIDAEPLSSLDAMREQGALAKELGVPIHGLVFGGWDTPFSSSDAKVIAKGIAGMENAMRCANAIGASTILLVPGIVTEEVGYADAYKRSQDNIRKLLPAARELNVIIAVENVWNKFLLSPLEFSRYIDEFESPNIRAYFDVGNAIINGYSQDWIRTLGKRIVKLDVKDFKRDGHNWTNLLDGDVNWRQVRRALDEIGYTGFMTAELNGGDEAYLAEVAKRMDQIIAM